MANVNNRKISNRATRGGSLGSRGSHKSASHNTTRDFHGDSEYEDNLVGWGSDPEVTRYHPNERKGRERKDFEQELRALQDDITMLSKKLSLPIPAVDGPRGRGSIGGIGGESRRIIGEDVNGSYGPGHKISRNGYESDAIDQLADRNYTESESEHPKGQLIRLQKQVRQLTYERDDALHQITQLQAENQQLKQLTDERNHLKSTCEHLLREIESLKISLQSSESIRKQQKELLAVFQRSQQLLDSSRHNSLPHFQHPPDDESISSSGGIGGIRGVDTSMYSRSAYIPSTPTISQPSMLLSSPAHGLSSPIPDHHQEKTPVSTKRMTRKKSTPSPPSSGGKATSIVGSQSTQRPKPTKPSFTPNATIGTPKFTTRSFAPSSDSDNSSKYSSSRMPGSTRSVVSLRTPPSQHSRPPLIPHSASSTHTPRSQSPVGTNKVKSRPQSAPPRPRGSFLHTFTTSPSSSLLHQNRRA